MSERLRSFLGVWAPLLVSLFLAATAVGFLLTSPDNASSLWPHRDLPPGWGGTWYLCGGGLLGVAALLAFSTLGRFRKARLVAREERERQEGRVK